MALSVTNSFKAEALLTTVTSIIRTFTWINSSFTSKIVENGFPIVTKDAKEVLGRGATYTLDNTDQAFNSVITSKGGFISKVATQAFGFGLVGGDETINIFSGKATNIEFNNDMTIDVTFADRLADLRRLRVGTNEQPASFTTSDYNPADIAWWVVTSFGGLVSSKAAGNADIDYPSWSSWHNIFEVASVRTKARFEGEDVIASLEKIREVTDSVIYVDQNNKLVFNKWVGVPPASFSIVNSTIMGVKNFEVDGAEILNKVEVQHGYDYSVNSWISKAPALTQFHNPGFESNVESWSLSLTGTGSASFAATTDNPHEGTKSGRVTITGDGALYTDIQVSPQPIDNFLYVANNLYSYSFWLRSNKTSNVRVQLTDVDCNLRGYANQETFNVTSPNVWYNFAYKFEPLISSSGRLNFFMGEVNSISQIQIDVVSLSNQTISSTSVDSPSQATFGVYEKIFDDTTISMVNSRSARWLSDWVAFGRAQPNTKLNVKMPMIFPYASLGDTAFVSYAPYSLNNAGFSISRFSLNINNGTMDLGLDEGFGFGGGRQAGFILDDGYYGLLDQTYNLLL